MKVVMLCKYPSSKDWGGVAIHIRYLVDELSKIRRKDLGLYVLSFGEKECNISEGNIRLIVIKIRWYYWVLPFLTLLRLNREIKRIRPDIIHLQGTTISPYSIFALVTHFHCRMMVTVHGFSHLEKASNRGSRLQFPIYYLFAKLIVRKFDHIITVTSRLRDYTISKLGSTSEKVSVVYNGVDADKFEPSIKGDIIREKYCIKDNEFVLIFAKAMIPQNGPQFLLKAMPRILDKHPNVRLIMAGDGPLREKLIQFAKKENFLEKIVFPGVVPHDLMRYFLAASDAVVIPSVSSSDQEEGMPNIMLEGMAMGKAIIASEIGGMKEIIDNRGIGILVPDKDDLSIAKAVFQLIQNPIYCSVLGEIAREYVTQNMTWARIADTTVAIYEGLNTSPPMMP